MVPSMTTGKPISINANSMQCFSLFALQLRMLFVCLSCAFAFFYSLFQHVRGTLCLIWTLLSFHPLPPLHPWHQHQTRPSSQQRTCRIWRSCLLSWRKESPKTTNRLTQRCKQQANSTRPSGISMSCEGRKWPSVKTSLGCWERLHSLQGFCWVFKKY